MSKTKWERDWDDIIKINIVDVFGVDELSAIIGAPNKISTSIINIFEFLKKLKNNKFYTKKELETIYLVVYEDIQYINDILYYMCSDEVVDTIYRVITNIFNELILIAKDLENYECSGNLLNFKNYWYSLNSIKINSNNEQK